MTGFGLYGLLIALTADGPAHTPASQPATSGIAQVAKFVVPEPVPPVFRPPDGARVCRYMLQENILTSVDGQPLVKTELSLDYAVIHSSPKLAEIQTIRAQAHAQRKDYRARLDSARPGDMLRIRSGSDTLLFPDMVEGFMLYEHPITVNFDHRTASIVGGTQKIRDSYVNAHPPFPRENPYYITRADYILSDTNLLRRLLPSNFMHVPTSTGTTAPAAVSLSMEGLKATGERIARAQAWKNGHLLVEIKEQYQPDGVIPNFPPNPHGTLSELYVTAHQTFEIIPDDPCAIQAATSRTTRFKRTSKSQSQMIEYSLIRMWHQKQK
ncbi:MAG: hypothetical protein KTR25_08680 [Myxococcales bacterium]|nr:hypothetical protein [Myxococcales bacterium]